MRSLTDPHSALSRLLGPLEFTFARHQTAVRIIDVRHDKIEYPDAPKSATLVQSRKSKHDDGRLPRRLVAPPSVPRKAVPVSHSRLQALIASKRTPEPVQYGGLRPPARMKYCYSRFWGG